MEAVGIFEEHALEFSLVILDYKMPRLSGDEVLKRINEMKKDAVILLSSGYSELEAAERFKGYSFSGFIHKPYEFNSLRDRISAVLGL